ncbi:hypothetical protein [Pseudomonas sp. UMAB-08]|uniref:hypothetical protein n=1 Tax=Pseudomonas sp. UMAB-08 TaxID=1365375 RepID=UPI001C55ED3B|nr:hypothetical protein [Pseudomonas sp. UMAB-08]
MISNHTSIVEHNRSESAGLAAAMAAFLARDGRIVQAKSIEPEPKPARSGRVDPETVLKRRRRSPTVEERKILRTLADPRRGRWSCLLVGAAGSDTVIALAYMAWRIYSGSQ